MKAFLIGFLKTDAGKGTACVCVGCLSFAFPLVLGSAALIAALVYAVRHFRTSFAKYDAEERARKKRNDVELDVASILDLTANGDEDRPEDRHIAAIKPAEPPVKRAEAGTRLHIPSVRSRSHHNSSV